jgi:rubrerythrin
MEIKDVLQLAVDEHKRSREFYLDCAASDIDLSGKRMFRFLADMKFSHQMMLSAELEMLEKYPAYMEEAKSWDPESRLTSEKMKRRK